MNRDDYRIRTGDELMYIVITLKNTNQVCIGLINDQAVSCLTGARPVRGPRSFIFVS